MGDDFKIRTLPRGNERTAPEISEKDSGSKFRPPKLGRAQLFVLGGALLAVIFAWEFSEKSQTVGTPRVPAEQEVMSETDERVSRHLRETTLKLELERRSLEIENDKLINAAGERPQPEIWDPPADRVYGLQLDQEDRSGKVFQDVNKNAAQDAELSPEDRINARLANSKWIYEMERAEQKQFVANFLRQAAENGYEITLNDQLVVVRVRKIPGQQRVPIDKILDQLNRQPSSSP